MISWDSVIGGGNLEPMASGDSIGRFLFIGVVGFTILVFGAWVAIQQRVDEPLQYAVISEDSDKIPSPVDDEPLEAVILDDIADDGSS